MTFSFLQGPVGTLTLHTYFRVCSSVLSVEGKLQQQTLQQNKYKFRDLTAATVLYLDRKHLLLKATDGECLILRKILETWIVTLPQLPLSR